MFINDIREKIMVALQEKRATITKQVIMGSGISDFSDYKRQIGIAKGIDEAIESVNDVFDKLLDEGD
jgi:hypothetical protein